MAREKYFGEDAARKDLGTPESKPAWLESQHSLPFHFLSADEFEIFCYLLLCRENPGENIFYYGKTGDAGRDIVRIKKDGSIELIQCKRYQNNVGISEIRAEIAKLYINLHHKIIPDCPNKVTFYVVPDLTAPAQDLIFQRFKWLDIAKSALAEHLKKAPPKELLNFSLLWYPQFSKETAIDLTQRAWKHRGLVEEFFAYKKVIDSEDPKLDAILNQTKTTESQLDEIHKVLKKIQETRQIPLQPNITDAPSALQNLLRKAEEENPGIGFTATLDSQVIALSVTAKPSAKDVCFGTLSFPNTEVGERGKHKLKVAMEEGRSIELESDEYEWKWAFNFPQIGSLPLTFKTLTICPQVPKNRFPIRLDVFPQQESVASVNFTYWQLVRAGTREIEFLVQGGQLAGKIAFISSFQDKKIILNLSDIVLSSVTAAQARNTISVLLALYKGGMLRFTLLDNDAMLFEGRKPTVEHSNFSEQELVDTVKFLDYLLKINNEFGLNLRYPETLDADTVGIAKEIVAAINCGQVERKSGTLRLTYGRQDALEILDLLRAEEPQSLSVQCETDYQLLGHVLPMGKTRITCENIFPIDELPALKQRVQALPESDSIQIAFRYDRAIESFLRWFPKSIDGQAD